MKDFTDCVERVTSAEDWVVSLTVATVDSAADVVCTFDPVVSAGCDVDSSD